VLNSESIRDTFSAAGADAAEVGNPPARPGVPIGANPEETLKQQKTTINFFQKSRSGPASLENSGSGAALDETAVHCESGLLGGRDFTLGGRRMGG
jgi:hypothetical protein